ncbi:unnamed protein product [Lactuca saligna]|uniref:CCHC-type domain-containing protein n=1 Tax=Lactuca saligna TaxID=75948 RepID=A0AA35ZVJ2_LACSI|nr:unnamed protein product [Lactuca saligna]
MDYKSPTFEGGESAMACLRWIRKMDQTFRSDEFTKEQKVNYAVRTFDKEALEWWDTNNARPNEVTRRAMTWEILSSMMISKYDTTFTKKSQFATDYFPTEEKFIRHYVEGLPFEYRAVMRLKNTLVETMDEAHKIENDIAIRDHTTSRSGEKRKWEGQSGSPEKQKFQKNGAKLTFYCKSIEPVCYNYRQMGHISTQCPNPKVQMGADEKKDEAPKVKARAFNMKTDEVIFGNPPS